MGINFENKLEKKKAPIVKENIELNCEDLKTRYADKITPEEIECIYKEILDGAVVKQYVLVLTEKKIKEEIKKREEK